MYASTRIGRIYAVKWEELTVTSVSRVAAEIASARAAAGAPVVYLAIIPEHSAVPGAAERAALRRWSGDVKDHLAGAHLVIAGLGERPSIHRSLLTGVLLVTGTIDGLMLHTHATAVGALARIALSVEIDTVEVLRALAARGFLAHEVAPPVAPVAAVAEPG